MSETLWMGKPLSEYTKEQLIEIINFLGKKEEILMSQHRRDIDMLTSLRRLS
jgi:hypothetical protein